MKELRMFENKKTTKVASNVGFADFPNISSIPSYGVFGRFGPKQGYIYTDDEDTDYDFGFIEDDDKQNHNFLLGGDQNIGSCIEGGINTRLYFSSPAADCLHNPIY